MDEHDQYVKTLIELHSGLERLGPGDNDFTESLLEQIPQLPPDPRIADLGCGTGAGALILAEKFRSRVKAVDFSREFLDQLSTRARQRGLEDLIEIIHSDIGNLDWRPGTIDLLWSEGAAYNLTFKGALAAWRPLLATGGIAVLSELNYFSADVSESVAKYMNDAYPEIKTEAENVTLLNSSGFEVLGVHRLPSTAWWDNYYNPLSERIGVMEISDDRVIRAVIRDTREEMKFFKEHGKDCGYTYYVGRAI